MARGHCLHWLVFFTAILRAGPRGFCSCAIRVRGCIVVVRSCVDLYDCGHVLCTLHLHRAEVVSGMTWASSGCHSGAAGACRVQWAGPLHVQLRGIFFIQLLNLALPALESCALLQI